MKGQSWVMVAIFLMIAVVLSGCVECEKASDCKDEKNVCIEGKCIPEKTGIDVYVGGNNGIVGKFIDPKFLYEGQNFEMVISFENKGEAKVAKNALKAYVGGTAWKGNYLAPAPNSKYYDSVSDLLRESNEDMDLDPVSKSAAGKALEGGYTELDFATVVDDNVLTAKDTAGMTSTFVATLCYPYETYAKAKACIGKTVSGEEGLCNPNADLDIDSSAAPIQITKISEKTSGNKHMFKIYFENKGNGKTYTGLEEGKNCVTGLSASNFGKIKIKNITLNDKQIPETGCKLEGEKSLSAGVVTCQYSAPEGLSPQTPTLKVTLSYNYIETFNKALIVSAS